MSILKRDIRVSADQQFIWVGLHVGYRIRANASVGLGVRAIKSDDMQSATLDAKAKDHFVIVDAVGVCEQDKTDSRPMEQKPTVSFDKILQAVAFGNTEDDVLSPTDLVVAERRMYKCICGQVS